MPGRQVRPASARAAQASSATGTPWRSGWGRISSRRPRPATASPRSARWTARQRRGGRAAAAVRTARPALMRRRPGVPELRSNAAWGALSPVGSFGPPDPYVSRRVLWTSAISHYDGGSAGSRTARLADSGTLTAAAGRLFLSHPALSQRLTRLEDKLGVRLFERAGRRLVPDPAGHRMLATSRHVLSELRAAERAVRRSATGATAMSASPPSAAPPSTGCRRSSAAFASSSPTPLFADEMVAPCANGHVRAIGSRERAVRAGRGRRVAPVGAAPTRHHAVTSPTCT